MASDSQICSVALNMLGQLPISSLSQNAPRAEKCNAIYETIRDIELASHNWKFATVYVELVIVDETPAFDFDYSFQLPQDFLKLVRTDSNSIKYRIVGDKLYTDDDEMYIEYIARITNPGDFSSPFTELLIARLAKDLAWGVTNNKALSIDLAENYKDVRRKATGIDSQAGTPRKLYRNAMNEARS